MSKGSGNRQRKHAWCRSENDRIFKRGETPTVVHEDLGPLMHISTELDYLEDFEPNGGLNKHVCHDCDRTFLGGKDRKLCKECAT